MRILIDESVPVQIRAGFAGHEVSTVREMGWGQAANGELLRSAEGKFEVLVTCDKNLKYQQNLKRYGFGVLEISTNKRRVIEENLGKIREALDMIRPGEVVEVLLPSG